MSTHFEAYPFSRRLGTGTAAWHNGEPQHQRSECAAAASLVHGAPADDEMAQLILEELSFSRRSFTGVAAEIANSPSSKSALGLNSISENEEDEEEE
ncbi:hypothetical protein GQ600_4166 [Phytophthora cactorum]|nr:hypothetical protein GQ600_4166 [Phytophthora cactorum]